MGSRAAARVTAVGGALAAYVFLARPRQLRWGATEQEAKQRLAGDQLIPNAALSATRAITVLTSPDLVWPWIAQLGQGRGRLLSYDFLENLIGCDIHSADRIVTEWQEIRIGDPIRLAPEVSLRVAALEPGRSLVLQGGIPLGNTVPPYDFTWTFALQDGPDETTRLLVRERYAYTRPWARLLVEAVEVISFLMSEKMLRGIKQRAEHAAHPG